MSNESARDFKGLMKGLSGGTGTRGFRPVNRGGAWRIEIELEMNDFRFGRSWVVLCGLEEPLEFVGAEIEDELREGVGLWAFVARVLVGLPAG